MHLYALLLEGKPAWDLIPEQFNVRGFTKRVSDPRCVTMIPSGTWQSPTENWELTTDKYGFRSGSRVVGTNKRNIVFIGDSVPFGWGVSTKDSVPSQLDDLLRERS